MLNLVDTVTRCRELTNRRIPWTRPTGSRLQDGYSVHYRGPWDRRS